MDKLLQFISDFFYLISINSINDIPRLFAYIVPFILVWTIYRRIKTKKFKKGAAYLHKAHKAGVEPASLHPIIDYNKCLGCGTCISACPEKDVIGLINDKAFLINPSLCIGHGVCKEACPQDAITLVFGSAKRGIDIPFLNPNFETNVPGIFIAGELGGMGLIRNAITQGRQAMEAVIKKPGMGKGDALDILIVGAGPAGMTATLFAIKHKLRYVTVEQDTLGGTIAHYPRGKIVMTAPAELPIIGKINFGETTKEKLLAFWKGVAKKTGMRVSFGERLESIEPSGSGFVVETTKHKYLVKNILLAIGRRGTPRKLGVPGEEQSKVIYSLTEPEQYRNQHVLVVGGGNSALEAAHSIAAEPGSKVTISYRSKTFSRAAEKNVLKVETAQKEGRLDVLMESSIKEIGAEDVIIEQGGQMIKKKNNTVIVCAGGILPTPMLKKIGIQVDTKYGTP